MKIDLPTTKRPALSQNPRILVLYGAPKVGKTSMLAALDDCLLLDLEDGARAHEALKLTVTRESWYDVLLELQDKSAPKYKYIALDTIDVFENWCEEWATDTYKTYPIGKNYSGPSVLALDKGSGYYWLRKEFENQLGELCQCAPNIILVGHLRTRFSDKAGKEVAARDLDLTGKIRNIVCSIADAIGYVYRSPEGQLMISFRTHEDLVCGARSPHLKGQEMPFEWSRIYL